MIEMNEREKELKRELENSEIILRRVILFTGELPETTKKTMIVQADINRKLLMNQPPG